MPIYNGNTKVNITSKGVVVPLTTPPAPKIAKPEYYTKGDRFLIMYTPTSQYIGLGAEHSGGWWKLPLVDDVSQAAPFLFRRYSPVEEDPREDLSLCCDFGNDDTHIVGSSGTATSGNLGTGDTLTYSGFYIKYEDYNDVLTSMYAYIEYFISQSSGWVKKNIYEITAGTYLTVRYSESKEPIALPFKLVKYVEAPSGIDKVYYGNTLVYQKQLLPSWHTIFEGSKELNTHLEKWNPGLVTMPSGNYKLRITFTCTSSVSNPTSDSLLYCAKNTPYEILFEEKGSSASYASIVDAVREFEFTSDDILLVQIYSKKSSTELKALELRWSKINNEFEVKFSQGTGGDAGCNPTMTITKVEQYY